MPRVRSRRPGARLVRALGLLLVAAGLGACGGSPRSEVPPPPAGWADTLLAHRAAKDAYFRGPRSPLTVEQRETFHGLRYFPPDPSFRFLAVPDRKGAGTPDTLMDTMGNVRPYRVAFRVHLVREHMPFTLTVYRSGEDPSLFLPFQDATTGRETYGVGRYVYVTPEPNGRVLIDFNTAYNPYCAYNNRWACPLVPPGNRAPLAVTAGEKKYHD
jgi:uncharacterized protein (DUF1684 family)